MIASIIANVISPAPLVIMIHGAGGGGWEYDFWRPAFEQAGYRVEAPDLMPSAKGLSRTTIQDYVNQVVAKGKPDVLIGASMGGVIALMAAERLKPRRLVLVCSALPLGPRSRKTDSPYPPVVRWKDGPYEDTVASMPDSSEETRRWAWPQWRDESGTALNALHQGLSAKPPNAATLCVIPLADDTVPPAEQMQLAKWAKADVLQFEGMSHVGPLLSTEAREVARRIVNWAKAP